MNAKSDLQADIDTYRYPYTNSYYIVLLRFSYYFRSEKGLGQG